MILADLMYSKTHEWVRVEGDIATIGISHHAQDELGDITFLELPEPGRILQRNDQFGEVESVKAVSELYSPVAGEVVEANIDITGTTEVVNIDPYGDGWLVKVRISEPEDLEALMNAAEYNEFLAAGGH